MTTNQAGGRKTEMKSWAHVFSWVILIHKHQPNMNIDYLNLKTVHVQNFELEGELLINLWAINL